MQHFKRESLIQVVILLSPVAIGIALAFVYPAVLTWIEKDKCLDAGGSYQSAPKHCEGARDVAKPPIDASPAAQKQAK